MYWEPLCEVPWQEEKGRIQIFWINKFMVWGPILIVLVTNDFDNDVWEAKSLASLEMKWKTERGVVCLCVSAGSLESLKIMRLFLISHFHLHNLCEIQVMAQKFSMKRQMNHQKATHRGYLIYFRISCKNNWSYTFEVVESLAATTRGIMCLASFCLESNVFA